ncbi:MAG: hypothetical protein COA90_06685 [Gammaproteobacteria bacterium]|nr:MAG: hypothetical protein COA90_06685 [Gammaproteobacteria bacterium]
MTDQNIRTQIIDAAEDCFSQYGYNKTTLAEIARDCNMSAANLYRYFDNKLDLGAAIAHQCLERKEDELTVIVRDDAMASADKLQAFIFKILHYTFNRFNDSPRISELVEVMGEQRPDVMAAHRQSSFNLLKELLEQGKQRGEFIFDNVDDTSDAINMALIGFQLPPIMSMFSLEEFEQKAKVVFELIQNSIKVR